MNVNLLDLLKSYLTDEVIGYASSFLGEGKTETGKAVNAILPTILGGLMSKASTTTGANSLLNMLNNQQNEGNMLNNLSGLFGGGDSSNDMLRTGSSVLGNIFGDKVGGVIDIISAASGMRKESSNNMLSFLAPVVMGLLGKLKGDNGLNASGLLSLLFSQKDFLKSALPAGLGSLLGFGNLDQLVKTAQSNLSGTYNFAANTFDSVQSNSTGSSKSGGMGWWPWLLLLPLALLLFWLWRSCGQEAAETVKQGTEQVGETIGDATQKVGEAAQEAGEAAKNAAENAGEAAKNAANQTAQGVQNAWKALGNFFKKKLPSGVELNIPELGVENKLITFIEDKTKPVDKTTWFEFDRLLFETGKDVLKPESQEQLKNIAEILKAYPNVNIKIGGYTDNTGDPKVNKKLSQDRASKVMAELVGMGIEGKRMEAEGYGDQHPIASNDTPEGREKNRRVAIRVTKK
ncbi:DUF937 domain-containing protein [Sphingobacteriales bacterium UPWRP_1]|nr:hypothetical protein B6N25_03440 [Sphingobacteriales bacterium TSM_CSS]PSJ76507.1 DUF937 domain-containing protein [Sphingobacteriales bacterium UPWRP_1]